MNKASYPKSRHQWPIRPNLLFHLVWIFWTFPARIYPMTKCFPGASSFEDSLAQECKWNGLFWRTELVDTFPFCTKNLYLLQLKKNGPSGRIAYGMGLPLAKAHWFVNMNKRSLVKISGQLHRALRGSQEVNMPLLFNTLSSPIIQYIFSTSKVSVTTTGNVFWLHNIAHASGTPVNSETLNWVWPNSNT